MGVDRGTALVVGVDAETPLEDGHSLMDRFLDGRWGPVEDAELAREEPGWARALFEERFSSEDPPGGLAAFQAGSLYAGEEDPSAVRLVVGIEVLRVEARDTLAGVVGPLGPDAIAGTMERVRQSLVAFGIEDAPRLYLVGTEA